MEIIATVRGITYKPTLCKDLPEYSLDDLAQGLSESAFHCRLDDGHVIAVSCWVSPKRTRSYPYARIYDTLGFGGRKVTIIPIVKDEGKAGDRDFLQWDTVALMGLLGVYVVLAFYSRAQVNSRYSGKITKQKFDEGFISAQLEALKFYHSSALHWNLEQFDRIPEVGLLAIEAYKSISSVLGVEMHSPAGMQDWVDRATASRVKFLSDSRARARAAQQREIRTVQPKEMFSGTKGSITIQDHVGGLYHLTSDHSQVVGDQLWLTESKHSAGNALPAIEDIKDGLIKIGLFCNLTGAQIDGAGYECRPILRLSCDSKFESLAARQLAELDRVGAEALLNNFELDLSGLWSARICPT